MHLTRAMTKEQLWSSWIFAYLSVNSVQKVAPHRPRMSHHNKYWIVGKVSKMHAPPGSPNIGAIGSIEVIKYENKHYPLISYLKIAKTKRKLLWWDHPQLHPRNMLHWIQIVSQQKSNFLSGLNDGLCPLLQVLKSRCGHIKVFAVSCLTKKGFLFQI